MEHVLVQMMSQLTSLSPAECQTIKESFPMKNFEKGDYLLKEGMIANQSFLVIKGCIREYEIIDGEEKTTAFYTEYDSAADFDSQANRKPSTKYFECTEATTVTVLDGEKEQSLYKKHPRFEHFCREGMEKMMGSQQAALSKFITSNPKQRYLTILEERPDLINRVPQYQLASYLGIKPETLSRIRSKMAAGK